MKRTLAVAALAAALGGTAWWVNVQASDHDDGETDIKARSLNLTDLYVFREGDQTGNAGDNGNLIFIMNTNPRSVARQQYSFSTTARYEFHVTRLANVDEAVRGADDVILRFQFGAPDAANQQAITLTVIRDGTETTVSAGVTTPLGQPSPAPVNNAVNVAGTGLTVFAGLREDPFFFDVEQFFRIRAGAAGTGPAVGSFRTADTAVDFTVGYNVNTIVVRVPITFLAGGSGATSFDVWETISIPD